MVQQSENENLYKFQQHWKPEKCLAVKPNSLKSKISAKLVSSVNSKLPNIAFK